MKKNVLISIIMTCILVSPIRVYADNNINTNNDNANNVIIYNPSANYDVSSENKSGIILKYNKDEQKILENTPKIGCKAAYIAEPTTGKVIYEKNAHEKMYPASTTKILTALVVLEKCQLTDKAIVSKNAINLVPSGYSNAKLQAGEELSISDLLYALLIPSANEAANVLAEHVSGSVEAFAELCNNRAKELGCETVHFVNPNGLHSEEHYCSAYDLYLIAKECQKYEAFNEIVKTKSFTLPATKIYPKQDRTFQNTNSLILPNSSSYYYSYCTGIKTGHTTPAGECLVASSSHNNINLISVVLGGGTNSKGLNERFYDTKQLFDFTYNNYSIKEIINKEKVIANIYVEHATKDTAALDVIVNTSISTIVPNDIDIDKIYQTIDIDNNISAPIKQNQVLGKVTFMVDGLNYTTDLIASHPVEKLPYWLYNSIVVVSIFFIIILCIIIFNFSKKYKKK